MEEKTRDGLGCILYQDENSKGWIIEVESISGWYRLGIYGSYKYAKSVFDAIK